MCQNVYVYPLQEYKQGERMFMFTSSNIKYKYLISITFGVLIKQKPEAFV